MTKTSLSGERSRPRFRPVVAALALTVGLFGTAAATAPAAEASRYQPGNLSGTVTTTAAQQAAKLSSAKKRVVGSGTKKSCTAAKLAAAVKAGGVVTFKCGKKPVTIKVSKTLEVRNATKKLVIDGGGKVTLSGNKNKRILYINTCDRRLGAVRGNCLYAPTYPQVTVQNLTLADGNATGTVARWDGSRQREGGGAIFALGGRLKVVKSTFVRNRCATNGPDLGGGAIRVLAQSSPTPNNLDSSYAARNQHPVQIVQSTFGGSASKGNSCSNGGAISTLRTPMTVTNSKLTYNRAVGCCSNPAKSGTPGGGSGGATYSDGNSYTLTFAGSRIERNSARAGGSAVFFVSNDRSGHLVFNRSVSRYNRYVTTGKYGDQHFQNHPGIFYLGKGAPVFTRSTIR